MAWDPIDEAELVPGYPVLKHMRQAWNSLKFLFGLLGTLAASGVQNGSFEVDSDGGGQPDNWVLNTYPGGSGGIVTDVPAHGKNAVRLVHPGGAGNGGGYYESDYVACSGLNKIVLGLVHWATAAGMHNQVIVRWYDKAKVFVSSAALYDSTNNPTSATYFVMGMQPPANARFYKLQLVGGYSDNAVAGAAYFDGVGVAGLEGAAAHLTPINIDLASNSSSNWLDVASFEIQIPFCSIPVVLSLSASVYGSTNLENNFHAAHLRFRIGDAYSNEISTPSRVPVNSSFSLPFTASSAGYQTVTVYMQLRATQSGASAWGLVADTAACVRINI